MGLFSNTMWKTRPHRLSIKKNSLRYRLSLKDAQICGDIQKQVKVPLRANMPSQGSSSAKTVVQSLEDPLGAPGKISSMCGAA